MSDPSPPKDPSSAPQTKGAHEESNGCYNCGSKAGNAITLCPACTKARLELRQGKSAAMAAKSSHNGLAHAPVAVERSLSDYLPLLYAGVGFLAAGWFALFSVWGPMWGYSPPERMYQLCRSKVAGAMSKQPSNLPNDPAMRAMAEGLMRSFSEGLCISVRTECESNPEGSKCKGFADMAKRL